jgi:hypothetical protein
LPDWHALVRERLASLPLDPAELEEVVAELAAHLEDSCRDGREDHATEPDASGQMLADTVDWSRVSRSIGRAKREVLGPRDRTRRVWLPGLLGLAVSMGWMALLQQANPRTGLPWLQSGLPLAAYLLWLGALPPLGATLSYVSRRAGGDTPARLTASLFPPMAMLAVGSLVVANGILVEGNPLILRDPMNLAVAALSWVVLPGLALLVGTLPFLDLRAPSAR